MTAVPLGETPSLCVLCPPTREKIARPGAFTDWGCLDRLDAQLGEVVARYARLSARLDPGHYDFVRRAPGYHSRPPVDMRTAALRDPRTFPSQLGELHSPLNLFISWATWIRAQRRQQPRPAYPTNEDLIVLDFEWRYLTHALDWITRQPWVTTFSEQLRACLSQLRSATHEPNPRPLGECEDCGHPLFRPSAGVDIHCGGCGRILDPVAQIEMRGRERRQRAVEADQAVSTKPCRGCGHDDLQHSNDEAERPCNVQWCDCTAFDDRWELSR